MSILLKPSGCLEFKSLKEEELACTLIISNPNNFPVTYKVKTTSVEHWVVTPNGRTIEAGGRIKVTAVRLIVKNPTTNMMRKDKFLVQSQRVPRNPGPFRQMFCGKPGPKGEPEIHKERLKVRFGSGSSKTGDRASGSAGDGENADESIPPAYSEFIESPEAFQNMKQERGSEACSNGDRGKSLTTDLACQLEQAQEEIQRLQAKVEGLSLALHQQQGFTPN
ncbi:hypothetical protein H0H92_003372 [Tricholoma furcatifolium]|nr:hypothetical protein H0H92_003372 [Tricholoma furcatifolium]